MLHKCHLPLPLPYATTGPFFRTDLHIPLFSQAADLSLYIRKSKAVKLPSRQGCYGQLLRLYTVEIQGASHIRGTPGAEQSCDLPYKGPL